jgi:hypothetical protein
MSRVQDYTIRIAYFLKFLEGYIDVPQEVPEILAPLVMKLCREYVDTSQSSGTPRYINGILYPMIRQCPYKKCYHKFPSFLRRITN